MKRLLTLLALFMSLHALAQSPVIRAHLEPESNIMVGQPVRLVVSVFVPNYFTGSPEFPEFEIDNAIVVQPQDRPANSNTQINGNTYFGITQAYVIYPQQAGDFHVPSAKLSVPYAIAPPRSIVTEAAMPALSFHADVPAAAHDLPYFLPTTRLTITQRWSRPLKDLRTGETVERTIIVTASKMQAMLIPPLELEQPEGIRIYNGEPTVRDQKTSRGDFVYGQRIQTAKYFIEKSGDYRLPAIELQWWNLSKRQLTTSSSDEVRFSATNNPEFVSELPPVDPTSTGRVSGDIKPWSRSPGKRRETIIAVISMLAIVLSAWLIRRAYRSMSAHLESYRSSESACFRKLIHGARSHDTKLTYVKLLEWSNRVFPGIPLGELLNDQSNLDLRYQVEALGVMIYSTQAAKTQEFNWDEFVLQLKRFRRQIHKSQSQMAKRQWLSTLNPY